MKICEKVRIGKNFGCFRLYGEVVSGDNVAMKKALGYLATRVFRERVLMFPEGFGIFDFEVERK